MGCVARSAGYGRSDPVWTVPTPRGRCRTCVGPWANTPSMPTASRSKHIASSEPAHCSSTLGQSGSSCDPDRQVHFLLSGSLASSTRRAPNGCASAAGRQPRGTSAVEVDLTEVGLFSNAAVRVVLAIREDRLRRGVAADRAHALGRRDPGTSWRSAASLVWWNSAEPLTPPRTRDIRGARTPPYSANALHSRLRRPICTPLKSQFGSSPPA